MFCAVSALCALGGVSGRRLGCPWLGIMPGTWQRPGMQQLRLLAAPVPDAAACSGQSAPVGVLLRAERRTWRNENENVGTDE